MRDYRAHWREHDRKAAADSQWALWETYPSGSGVTTLAESMQARGALYAANLALHAFRMALAVNKDDDGNIDGLALLSGVDDPEGVTFAELTHRESIDSMTDDELGNLAHRLGEAHARLQAEYRRRVKP